MTAWNATHYLTYANERTRPAFDLAARVMLDAPAAIVDLGCGPGNSTAILRERWPAAQVVGIDNSPEMLAVARKSHPNQQWLLTDVAQWRPEQPFDLLYSNAALQWMPDHGALIPRLFSHVAPGGAFAAQIPSSTFAAVRTLIHEISHDPAWNQRMDVARNTLTMESPSFYYDALVGDAAKIDLWETEYNHVLESKAAIVDWIASTGLRPFLAALDDDGERTDFLGRLQERVNAAYESRIDGKVLFPFRRMFVIAYR